MLLAAMVAAAVLAQAPGPAPAAPRCIEPPSRYGPPPCAAANVAGCIPGYHRQVDAWGRVRYVCDAYAYTPPEPSYPPPPPAPEPEAFPAPPPDPGGAPPRYRPPGRYAAPFYAPPRRGQFGIVFLPGVSSTPSYLGETSATGAVGVELRPQVGGGRLRFAFEAARFGRAAELALKYDFNDSGQVRPFLALGIGGASIDPDPGWRLSASISGGLDLYVSRDFFFSLELKQRGFARRSAAAAYGLEPGGLSQTALFMGVGLYF